MSTITTSLSRALADDTLTKITTRLALEEVQGAEGGPFLSLKSAMSPAPVGWVRLFRGSKIQKVVNVGLVVPQFGLDSHMIFAFTNADSPIPHFTIDSVQGKDFLAFHLDLIPRADLGAHLDYMNAVFHPLTSVFAEATKIEGLTPAHLSPRQNAIMSPWMLAYRATEEAFKRIGAPVDAYLQHWFNLVEKGISPEITRELSPEAWALRDRKNRAAIFNPDVDPVWNQVDRLVGAETSARMREILKTQEAVKA